MVAKANDTLETLFVHLHGPIVGRAVTDMAAVRAGERVLVFGHYFGSAADTPLESAASDDAPDDDVLDPLPVVRLTQPEDEAEFRQDLAAGWDVFVGIPPQGSPDGDELFDEFLMALGESAAPGSRAVLVIAAGLLARTNPVLRESLLRHGSIRAVAFPVAPVPWSVGLLAQTRVAVVAWSPGQGPSSPTSVVSLSATGEIDGRYTAELTMEAQWSFAALDPGRRKRIAEWSKRTSAVPLTELADVRPRDASSSTLMPLAPQQISSDGLDLSVQVRPFDSKRDGPLRAVHRGDIVGRTIGPPHWTEVSSDEPLGATRQVIVIRPVAIDPSVLLAFLHSDVAESQLEVAAQGSTIQRVSERALRQLLVPSVFASLRLPPTDEVIRAFRRSSTALADELVARYRAAFDNADQHGVVEAIADAAGDAQLALDLLQRAASPMHRATQSLPHPLARILRSYERSVNSSAQSNVYQDLVRFGETTIILLGIVGLAYMNAERTATAEVHDWHTRLRTGGVALGTWLACANSGAEVARRAGEQLGGLATALSTGSTLNRILDDFLKERNESAHGAGPRSAIEYQQRVGHLQSHLVVALDELLPLARSEWFIVDSLAWSSRTGEYTAVGRSLVGDHPDFAPWRSSRPTPLEAGVVTVRLGELELRVHGYCQLRSCSTCYNDELYYPDRLRGSVLRVRSLDRGHQADVALSDSALPIPPGI